MWLTVDRPGVAQYVDLSGYEKEPSNEVPRKIIDGCSTVLNPDGSPLCVIKLNASAYAPGNGDCLLSQSQMEHHGCKFTQTGFQTISHPHWPIQVHCLPRGNGWFLPLRKPTKKDWILLISKSNQWTSISTLPLCASALLLDRKVVPALFEYNALILSIGKGRGDRS